MSKKVQLNQKLIDECKLNNAKAQMQLYNLYCKAMLIVANRYVKDRFLAEDIMQDAFIKCFKKIDSYKGEVAFGAWLKRIVINQSIDELKRTKLEIVSINEEVYQQTNEKANDWNIEAIIPTEKVVETINGLKEKYRLVLSLYLLEGYDHSEIASILNITENTSRTHLLRGKNLVKQELKMLKNAARY